MTSRKTPMQKLASVIFAKKAQLSDTTDLQALRPAPEFGRMRFFDPKSYAKAVLRGKGPATQRIWDNMRLQPSPEERAQLAEQLRSEWLAQQRAEQHRQRVEKIDNNIKSTFGPLASAYQAAVLANRAAASNLSSGDVPIQFDEGGYSPAEEQAALQNLRHTLSIPTGPRNVSGHIPSPADTASVGSLIGEKVPKMPRQFAPSGSVLPTPTPPPFSGSGIKLTPPKPLAKSGSARMTPMQKLASVLATKRAQDSSVTPPLIPPSAFTPTTLDQLEKMRRDAIANDPQTQRTLDIIRDAIKSKSDNAAHATGQQDYIANQRQANKVIADQNYDALANRDLDAIESRAGAMEIADQDMWMDQESSGKKQVSPAPVSPLMDWYRKNLAPYRSTAMNVAGGTMLAGGLGAALLAKRRRDRILGILSALGGAGALGVNYYMNNRPRA